MNKENIQNLLEALKEFGFGSLGLKPEDFLSPENIIQLGNESNRIDMLMDLEGVDFEKCYRRKTEIELDGIKTNFLSLQDLIKVKKTTGRLQDLADAEQLEKILVKKNKN